MLSLTNEIIRKLIHTGTSIIPISYYYISKFDIVLILVPTTIIFVFFDIYRRRHEFLKKLYNKYFAGITRHEEKKSFTGATWALVACIATIIFFHKEVAIISLLLMTISDSLAAIIGKKYGSIKFLSKTLEGSLTFFISSLFIILFLSSLDILIAIICIAIVTCVEASKFLNIDDNISIPLSFAMSYALINNMLLPLVI